MNQIKYINTIYKIGVILTLTLSPSWGQSLPSNCNECIASKKLQLENQKTLAQMLDLEKRNKAALERAPSKSAEVKILSNLALIAIKIQSGNTKEELYQMQLNSPVCKSCGKTSASGGPT